MQDEEDAMGAIVGASITYRLAFGPNAGRKGLTLQTVPVRTDQRTFKSAQMEGRQPVEVGVLFLKWKKGGYSS